METYKIDRISRWWWIVTGAIIFLFTLLLFPSKGEKDWSVFLVLIIYTILFSIPLGIRLLINKILEKRARAYIDDMLTQIKQTNTLDELNEISVKLGKRRRESVKHFVYKNGIGPHKEQLATPIYQKRESEVKERLGVANQVYQLQEVIPLMSDIDTFIQFTEAVRKNLKRMVKSYSKNMNFTFLITISIY